MIEEFVSFELESRNYDRSHAGIQNSTVKVHLSPVESLESVRSYIEQVYNRYKEEFGYHQINIFLSVNAAYHLMRIHRVLSFPQWFVGFLFDFFLDIKSIDFFYVYLILFLVEIFFWLEMLEIT